MDRAHENLSEGDLIAIRWFSRNVTGFVKDFCMMPNLIDRLGMDEVQRELFLVKLNIIYQSVLEGRMEES